MLNLVSLRERPVWRASLAVISLVVNLTLPAAWSQAAPHSTVFGSTFSICLADGSTKSAIPSGEQPGSPINASATHCILCVFAGGFEAAPGSGDATAIANRLPLSIVYGYAEPFLTAQAHGKAFDARAPPA